MHIEVRLEVGQVITLTDEIMDFLVQNNLFHTGQMGDDLILTRLEILEKRGATIYPASHAGWYANIPCILARRARAFWVEQNELLRHGQGKASELPLARWYAPYNGMTVEEKRAFYARYVEGEPEVCFQIARYLDQVERHSLSE